MSEWSYYEISDVKDGVKKTKDTVAVMAKKQDQALANDKAMLDAFAKISKQLGELTTEIKGLRSDMNPKLDKTVKLAPPANQ